MSASFVRDVAEGDADKGDGALGVRLTTRTRARGCRRLFVWDQQNRATATTFVETRAGAHRAVAPLTITAAAAAHDAQLAARKSCFALMWQERIARDRDWRACAQLGAGSEPNATARAHAPATECKEQRQRRLACLKFAKSQIQMRICANKSRSPPSARVRRTTARAFFHPQTCPLPCGAANANVVAKKMSWQGKVAPAAKSHRRSPPPVVEARAMHGTRGHARPRGLRVLGAGVPARIARLGHRSPRLVSSKPGHDLINCLKHLLGGQQHERFCTGCHVLQRCCRDDTCECPRRSVNSRGALCAGQRGRVQQRERGLAIVRV